MRFADKNGWSYTVREPQLSPRIRTKRFNEYGDNFSTKRAGVPIGGLISETIGDKNKEYVVSNLYFSPSVCRKYVH